VCVCARHHKIYACPLLPFVQPFNFVSFDYRGWTGIRYTGFSVWLHNVSGAPLKTGAGEDNVLAVFLHSTVYTYELWGYEGAGITRDVSLVVHDSHQSITPWGVVAGASVVGPVAAPSGACGPQSATASVAPTVDVSNAAGSTASLRLLASVVTHAGAVVASTAMDVKLAAGGWSRLTLPPMRLENAALWSPACTPDASVRPLYVCAFFLFLFQSQSCASFLLLNSDTICIDARH
jgi:hypothetical protein